jgi:hypothetical protein
MAVTISPLSSQIIKTTFLALSTSLIATPYLGSSAADLSLIR